MNDTRFNSLNNKNLKNNRGRNLINLNNDDEHNEEVIEPNHDISTFEELDDEDIIDIDFDNLVRDAKRTNESTNKLAVFNFDFENYPLSHLANIIKSFLPKSGKIISISKIPTEEYMERYQDDCSKGPKEYLNAEPGVKAYKIYRKYQISRLKFFYGIFQFDSIETADYIYNELDGMNLGDSGLKLDLRYVSANRNFEIPDEFKHLIETLDPNLKRFKSVDFAASCFATTKVTDDWDVDHKLEAANLRAFQESDEDLSEIEIGVSESESENSTTNETAEERVYRKKEKVKKVRELLGLPAEEISEPEEAVNQSDIEMSSCDDYGDDVTEEQEISNSEEEETNQKERKQKKISQRMKKKLILKEIDEKKRKELRERREYLKSIAGSDAMYDACKDLLANPHLYRIDRNNQKYLDALMITEMMNECAAARGIPADFPKPDFSQFETSRKSKAKRPANRTSRIEPVIKKRKD